MTLDLFPPNQIIGVFRGFKEGGLEFHADIALPYREKLHNIPMHGQFLIVQLEHPDEAVLGRITSLSAEGKLTGASGEQYSMRSVNEGRKVPDDLRENYLKYRVDIRILGVIRAEDSERIVFVPSHRRLPHVGSPVAFLSDEVLSHVVGHEGEGAEIGFFALGEYIYAGNDERLEPESWMQVKEPCLTIKFPIQNLVSRRTFVFARAGFGKSNLNKLLFSTLYKQKPTVEKRQGKKVPVGTVIFDPDGEYFWPDDKGKPGLCDVRDLRDQIVVFTSREAPSQYYSSFVASGVKLDIRRLSPGDVISIALSPDKQEQQNVKKLRGLNMNSWSELVDLVDRHGNAADIDIILRILHLDERQEAEAYAARSHMTNIVRMLHDKSSQLMDILLEALSDGKLCIIDVSQLRGGPSLILSGLILRRIFDRNQEEFTKSNPRSIPTIAVVEEAQSVLNEKSSAAAPYIEWVKEGRKYDLGAFLVTQQPGSIPTEILSQGDNWFMFHLLSESDLTNAKRSNAHFSKDLLSTLLNEPIKGQGVFWSSAGETIYPIPLRALSFEKLYKTYDSRYDLPPVDTYASALKGKYTVLPDFTKSQDLIDEDLDFFDENAPNRSDSIDPFKAIQDSAIQALVNDSALVEEFEAGIPYGKVKGLIKDQLPAHMDDRDNIAYRLVPKASDAIAGGGQGTHWETVRKGEKNTLFIKKIS